MTPQNNIPPDMDALLAWLKGQALKEHNLAVKHHGFTKGLEHEAAEKFANRVIAKIENSRVNQKAHVPQGWDEVG